MTALTLDDPRLTRMMQKVGDDRIKKIVGKLIPDHDYGEIVLVDAIEREVTVRQRRGTVTTDVPHVKFGNFTPEVGQQVGYTTHRLTGDTYLDLAVDPVTPSAAAAEAVAALALDRIRLASVTTETIPGGESLLVTVTWDAPFGDTAYLIFPSIEENNVNTGTTTGVTVQVASHTEADAIVRVSNATPEDRTPVLNVLAIHI